MKFPIKVQQLKDSWLLFLPLPPSTNARMRPVIVGRHAQNILTKEAREYIKNTKLNIWNWAKMFYLNKIKTYTIVEFWFILSRTNSDCHNYLKVILDTFEGSITTNDKYILPSICGVWHDAKNPEVIVRLKN